MCEKKKKDAGRCINVINDFWEEEICLKHGYDFKELCAQCKEKNVQHKDS